MPTPLELLLDPVSLIILALYAGLMSWEALAPARALPQRRGWRTAGMISFAGFFYLSSYLPLVWDRWLAPYQLFDLTGLGVAGGTLAGLLVFEVGLYAWHRLLHRSDILWRAFHQMHHSAERLDTFGAFYFSPLDMIGFTLLGSLCLVLGVGVLPQAATLILLLTTFLSIFQHANVRTPRWLGYVVQRPESHAIHHGRGIHAWNYADLPLLDMLFGSFRNPSDYVAETGFYPGAWRRVIDMLLWRDVSRPPTEDPSSRPSNAPRRAGDGIATLG